MKGRQDHDTDSETVAEQLDYYLPGTPRLTVGDSRIERRVRSILRRRGGLRPGWQGGSERKQPRDPS